MGSPISLPDALAPFVGADVIYVSYGTPGGEYAPECRAAKITKVGAWVTAGVEAIDRGDPAAEPMDGDLRILRQAYQATTCILTVFNPGGIHLTFERPCPYDFGHTLLGVPSGELVYAGGTWHWPE